MPDLVINPSGDGTSDGPSISYTTDPEGIPAPAGKTRAYWNERTYAVDGSGNWYRIDTSANHTTLNFTIPAPQVGVLAPGMPTGSDAENDDSTTAIFTDYIVHYRVINGSWVESARYVKTASSSGRIEWVAGNIAREVFQNIDGFIYEFDCVAGQEPNVAPETSDKTVWEMKHDGEDIFYHWKVAQYYRENVQQVRVKNAATATSPDYFYTVIKQPVTVAERQVEPNTFAGREFYKPQHGTPAQPTS